MEPIFPFLATLKFVPQSGLSLEVSSGIPIDIMISFLLADGTYISKLGNYSLSNAVCRNFARHWFGQVFDAPVLVLFGTNRNFHQSAQRQQPRHWLREKSVREVLQTRSGCYFSYRKPASNSHHERSCRWRICHRRSGTEQTSPSWQN